MSEAPRVDWGLRLIVAYKIFKAASEFLVAGLLLLLPGEGLTHVLHHLADAIKDHAAAAWSLALAHLLLEATTHRHLQLIAAAAILDGLFSLFEGWALHRRFWWAHWLIIVATSTLVPFEIERLFHRVSLGRVVILIVNLAIVGYLAWRRIRHLRATRRHALASL